MKTIAKHFMDAMRPKGRPGRLPNVTPCPYCGAHMSQGEHAKHRGPCEAAFQGRALQSSELAQDRGGGYNRDGTFPQQ